MSQDHRMLESEECLVIINSSTPILLRRKAGEAGGPLQATHGVSNRATLKTACQSEGHWSSCS